MGCWTFCGRAKVEEKQHGGRGCWKQSCQRREKERVGLVEWDATSAKIQQDNDDGQW